MRLSRIISIADKTYPDGLVAEAYRALKSRKAEGSQSAAGVGDLLAVFIASELTETFDPKASSAAQLNEAIRVMENARYQLADVQVALQEAADKAAKV